MDSLNKKGPHSSELPDICSLTVPLENVVNARQLGGYPTGDGHFVKKNLLLRTGCLEKLTDEGAHLLKERFHLPESMSCWESAGF